jgi:hypothetical protein
MRNKKTSSIKKLALALGVGVVGYKIVTGSEAGERSANVEIQNRIDAGEFALEVIKRPSLAAILKGEKGATGDTGTAGATGSAGTNGTNGAAGVDGNQVQNFGGSLLINGAGELLNNSNWNHCVYTLTDGIPSLKYSVGNIGNENSTYFHVPQNRLLKVSFEGKVSSAYGLITILSYDSDKISIAGYSYPASFSNTIFEQKNNYFGGFGSGLSEFRNGARFSKFGFRSFTVDAEVYIRNLSVTSVYLSEPVPYTLPWLPTGQSVLDPTTGDRGIWNGSTFDWFTFQA